MLCARSFALATPSKAHRADRPRVVACVASSRRDVFAVGAGVLLAASTLLSGPAPVIASDYKAKLAEKEARKARMRQAAGEMRATKTDVQIFEMPEASLGEESHTPNAHSRQNEGARTQENV